MFSIDDSQAGVIRFSGKFHAAHTDKAREALSGVEGPLVLDFQDLEYISSSGLGVLLGAQHRLDKTGNKLKIINANRHVRELFRVSRMDLILEVE